MKPVFPGSFVILALSVALTLVLFSMRVIQPDWYRARVGRMAVLVTFSGMLAGIVFWATGRAIGSAALVHAGAAITYVGVFVTLPTALVMPIAAAIDRLGMRLLRARAVPEEPPQAVAKISRRSVLRLGTAALPTAVGAAGASGFFQASGAPKLPIVRLAYPDLHPDLEGLRILQLSDLHLGACLGLDDLRRALETARRHAPDLIVLTGDLADDVNLIPDALRLVAGAGARYGAMAVLGNHEYLHDIDVTRPMFEESPVPLLVDDGRSLRIGRATLFVGGADDPVAFRGDIAQLVAPSIAAAASACPRTCDFRLLLCHRPEGFGPANEHGFDLTLSGHTHGGQLGLFGRSILEQLRPGVGWWGNYAKKRPPQIAEAQRQAGPGGPSRLYTTSGFGHWFPFRVGCPTEMPLIVLSASTERAEVPRRV
jgi:predicted MPP superfamily phosphohydrolase